MAAYPQGVERVIAALSRLPGIGRKTAERLALYLLRSPQGLAGELASALAGLSRVTTCSVCHNLADRDPCRICGDPARNREQVCVVETPADLTALEAAGTYQGLYHVLAGSLDPLEGMGPNDLRLNELAARVAKGKVREVIIATNPSVEGEATADLVARRLAESGATITRLGYGMPVGGDLKYMDGLTLSRSLDSRRRFSDD